MINLFKQQGPTGTISDKLLRMLEYHLFAHLSLFGLNQMSVSPVEIHFLSQLICDFAVLVTAPQFLTKQRNTLVSNKCYETETLHFCFLIINSLYGIYIYICLLYICFCQVPNKYPTSAPQAKVLLSEWLQNRNTERRNRRIKEY